MKSVLALLVLAASLSATAQIHLGQPSYGGNGCPQGTAAVAVTEDGKTLSVLFDRFIAEAGNTTGRRIDRASCNLRIPVSIPAGFSVAIIQSDYRGFTAVPGGGASATFNAEQFFAGQARGPKTTKKFVGPRNDDFLISAPVVATAWSQCGGDAILAVNTSATAMSNSAMQQTMIAVDSLDINQQDVGIFYSLSYRRCSR